MNSAGMNSAQRSPWADTLEEPNVNRPFYAFGALLAALALAMLAVSSTSRSTTVGSAAPALRSGSAARPVSPKLRQRASFCSVVVVLPAANEVDRIATIATGSAECLAYVSDTGANCPVDAGWQDEDLGEDNWDCRDVCPLMGARPEPQSVEIVQMATHDPALLRDETSRDCRSHYDLAYDVLVYGEVDSPPGATPWAHPIAAAKRRLAPVDWSDYADLLDSALAARARESTSAESTISVRSSHRLLDFAATALKNAGIMLQTAGEQLQNATSPSAEDHVAGEHQASQR